VRGQYTAGYIKGDAVPGYLEEEGANTESTTESFVALRVDIDNWRWAGVPFYLRTGKRLTGKRTEIVVYFKQLPHNIFKDSFRELPPNKLIIHLQPNEGVEIEMLNKIPGIDEHIKLKKTKLDLSFPMPLKRAAFSAVMKNWYWKPCAVTPRCFSAAKKLNRPGPGLIPYRMPGTIIKIRLNLIRPEHGGQSPRLP